MGREADSTANVTTDTPRNTNQFVKFYVRNDNFNSTERQVAS